MTKANHEYHNIQIWIIFCDLAPVSNVFQSMKTPQANIFLSKALLICSVKLIKACIIEWLFPKTN